MWQGVLKRGRIKLRVGREGRREERKRKRKRRRRGKVSKRRH